MPSLFYLFFVGGAEGGGGEADGLLDLPIYLTVYLFRILSCISDLPSGLTFL